MYRIAFITMSLIGLSWFGFSSPVGDPPFLVPKLKNRDIYLKACRCLLFEIRQNEKEKEKLSKQVSENINEITILETAKKRIEERLTFQGEPGPFVLSYGANQGYLMALLKNLEENYNSLLNKQQVINILNATPDTSCHQALLQDYGFDEATIASFNPETFFTQNDREKINTLREEKAVLQAKIKQAPAKAYKERKTHEFRVKNHEQDILESRTLSDALNNLNMDNIIKDMSIRALDIHIERLRKKLQSMR